MGHQGIILFLLILFLYLFGDFNSLKGMEYPLLRILMELIGIILILIIFLHKKEILVPNQRRIEDFFKKKKQSKTI